MMRNRVAIELNEDNLNNLNYVKVEQVSSFKSIYITLRNICLHPLSFMRKNEFEIIEDSSKIKRNNIFRVLGIDISNWSRTSQYLFCSICGISFLLMYGILQEFVVMNKFHRSLGWFITFLQLSGYALCGFFQHDVISMKFSERKIPIQYYCLFSILHVTMQGCTNLAMQYLNYPAKTLFKSSRVIVTMIFGGCCMGKRYKSNDFIVAGMIIAGLSLFVVCDAQTSPVFDPTGIFYITLALCADSAILNIQEFCLNAYNAGHDELVYYTYMGSAIVSCLMTIINGEMLQGIAFLHETGSISMLFMFIVFCSMGFLGMSCFAALTKKFGALTSAITSTTRKGLTLVLSYICFPSDKSITWGHFFGAIIFLGGLLLKSIQKDTLHHTLPHQVSNNDNNNDHNNNNNNINGNGNGNNNNKENNTIEVDSNKKKSYIQYFTSIFDQKSNNTIPPQDEQWNIPFGVKSRIETDGIKTKRRPIIVVGGSVHCEGEAGSGIGGLGLEIETDEEDDDNIEIYKVDLESNISPSKSHGKSLINNNNNNNSNNNNNNSNSNSSSNNNLNDNSSSSSISDKSSNLIRTSNSGTLLERLNSREKIQQQQQQLQQQLNV